MTLLFRISSNCSVSSPEGKGEQTDVEYFCIHLFILNDSCLFTPLDNLYQQASPVPKRYITLQLPGFNKRTISTFVNPF